MILRRWEMRTDGRVLVSDGRRVTGTLGRFWTRSAALEAVERANETLRGSRASVYLLDRKNVGEQYDSFILMAIDHVATTGLVPLEIEGTSLEELSRIARRERPCRNPNHCGMVEKHMHGYMCTPTCTVCGKVK